MRQPSLRATVFAPLLLLAGCATPPAPDPRDPLEPFNRDVEAVDRALDVGALRPTARAYQRTVPGVVRTGVSNFFSNLRDPWSAVNSLLQLKIGDAAQNAMRFAVNTVFGLGGLIDIASDAGIERHKADFGTTLGRWGVSAGPYMVLPVLGPSTLRDTLALPVDWLGDPLRLVAPGIDRSALLAGRAIDFRATLLPMDAVLDEALDRYTFLRDVYYQRRDAQLHGTREQPDDAPSDAAPPAGEAADDAAQPLPSLDQGEPS